MVGHPLWITLPTDVTVGTSSTPVLSNNEKRSGAIIVNDSDNTVYLMFGERLPAALNRGIRLNARGGSLTIDRNFYWNGSVYAIAGASSVLTVTEIEGFGQVGHGTGGTFSYRVS